MSAIVVTTLDDVIGVDGEVSLREAIIAANTDMAGFDAPAGEAGAPDTITFAPALSGGTIHLTATLPTLTGETVIDGDIDGDGRPDITITGDVDGDDPLVQDLLGNLISDDSVLLLTTPENSDNLDTIFEIAGTATLNGLVITGAVPNGDPPLPMIVGGAGSSITVTNSSISGNFSISAISNVGGTTVLDTVLLSDSIFIEGISQINGTLEARNLNLYRADSFSNLLYIEDSVASLVNSTITDSFTPNFLFGVSGSDFDIVHTTMTGNIADFAVFEAAGGNLGITNSIISGNGSLPLFAAEFVTPPHQVTDSIIGGDPADYFAEIDPVTEGGMLRDNGGPLPTVLLRVDNDNPAIDIGTAVGLGLLTDARGEFRAIDFPGIANGGALDTADAGAVEMRIPDPLIVTTADDELDDASAGANIADMGGAGDLSLREALHLANNAVGPSRILFDETVFTGGAASLIRLGLGTLTISDDVEIDADLDDDGRPDVTVSGDADGDDLTTTDALGNTITDTASNGDVADRLSDNARVFEITDGTVEIDGLVVTGGYAEGSVGSAAERGGGIHVAFGAELAIANSSISGNVAERFGGGIRTEIASILTVTNSTVAGNATELGAGGGISNLGFADISASTISGNTAQASGGGIDTAFGTLSLANATVAGNTAGAGGVGDGGGIRNSTGGRVDLDSTTITGNSAADSGGGFFNTPGAIGTGNAGGDVTIANSIVLGNTAGTDAETSGPRTVVSNSITGTEAPATVFANLDGTGGALALTAGDVETVTLRAAADNPAIDAATSGLASDARGLLRGIDIAGVANGGLDDLGAYEIQPGDVPGIVSITRGLGLIELTNADILAFTLTFSEAVTVDAADLAITGGSTASVDYFSGSGAEWTFRVIGGDLAGFDGTVGLELAATQDITSVAGGQPLLVTTAPVSETFTLDNTAPAVDTNAGATLDEGTAAEIGAAALASTDGRAAAGGVIYEVTTAVANGTLFLDTTPDGLFTAGETVLGFGASFTQADIDAGLLHYQHDGGETTEDGFGFSVSDGLNTLADQSFAIMVDPVNDPPVAEDDAFETPANIVLSGGNVLSDNGSGADSDVDSPTLTVTEVNGAAADVGETVTLASGASLTLNADGSFIYDAAGAFDALSAGEEDTDGFTYQIGDGSGGFDTAAVTVTVTGLNNAPENTVPGAQETDEDTALAIPSVSITDVEGDAITTMLSVEHGTLSASGPAAISGGGSDAVTMAGSLADVNATLATLGYQPDADYFGPDTLTVATQDDGGTADGGMDSDTDTVAITVLSVNDAPVNSVPGPQETDEDTALAIPSVSIADVEGDAVTTMLSVGHGTLSVSGPATVSQNGTDAVTLAGSLADVNATLATLGYQPDADFFGADTLTVATQDDGGTANGGMDSDTDTVAITVGSVEDAPEIEADGTDPTYIENADPVAVFSGAILDPVEAGQRIDGIGLDISGLLDGALEMLTIDGAALALTDGTTISLPGGGTATVSGNADRVSVTLSGLGLNPGEAAALLDGIGFSVAGENPSAGVRQVRLDEVEDDAGARATPSISSRVTVEPVNDPPSAGDDSAALLLPDTALLVPVLDNDSDPEGDRLTVVSLDTAGLRGSADILADSAVRYTIGGAFGDLGAGETATETLIYTVADPFGAKTTAMLTITVTGSDTPPPVGPDDPDPGDPGDPGDPDNPDDPDTPPGGANSPPLAADDRFLRSAIAPVAGDLLADNGTGPDRDADGDPLAIASAGGEPPGTAIALASGAMLTVQASGGFSYDPGDAFDGAAPGTTVSDGFSYVLSDGQGGTDTASVTILFELPAEVERVPGTEDDDRFEFDDLDTARRVEGGAGEDTAVLPVTLAEIAIEPIDGGFRLLPVDGEPIDLVSVEQIELTDATIVVDTGETLTKLALIYLAAFDRMPDILGLTFWNAQIAAGVGIDPIADAFASADEFAAIHGGLLDDEDYVRSVYRNATDREGDEPGIAFWTDAIGSGALDRGDLLIAFACSDEVRDLHANAIDDGLLLLA
ncbi:hypothetical protein LNKW23_47650 [Paralimibaculum aggregatum]|uniref:DUF4214 domain-containing protein n=1 Tax=Paralimibaculum aggregatum TaxID=3036245 RepID=A0ABQ6LU20_9RHOB|nr:Ig-like domain-containing protein [Limibaculum sp. NKW23]GMG85542.1 hypothetical protein LNKW23_47650 [Limibaculum sp. NKW23]